MARTFQPDDSNYVCGVDERAFIGSVPYQAVRDRALARQPKPRTFSSHADCAKQYRTLDRVKSEVYNVSGSGETVTGKQLGSTVVTVLELEMAMQTAQRTQQITARERQMFWLTQVRGLSRRRVANRFKCDENEVGKIVRRVVGVLTKVVYETARAESPAAECRVARNPCS